VTYSPLPQTTLERDVNQHRPLDRDRLGHGVRLLLRCQPVSRSQRAYWIEYPAVTKVGMGVSQVLRQGLTAFVRAENLGNNLRYEVNNAFVHEAAQCNRRANVNY